MTRPRTEHAHRKSVANVSCVEEDVHHDNHNIHVRAGTQYWAMRTFTLDILVLVATTTQTDKRVSHQAD